MEYKIKKDGDFTILNLEKDVSVYQFAKFKEAIAAIKKQEGNSKRVIIDLKEVGYIDALALGALTDFSKEVREGGGDIKIINMNEDIKLVFDLSRLSRVYEIYNSMQEAQKSFL